MKFSTGLWSAATLLTTTATFASPSIIGKYMPESALPKNVCALYQINLVVTDTPIDQNKKPIGPPTFEKVPEWFTCSATLINDHAVLTAAHCFQGIQEYRPRLGKDKEGKLHRIDMKMDKMEIRCPGDDGQIEVHSTFVEDGFPHPRFGMKADEQVFDIAVLKTKEKWKTKPMPVAMAQNSVRDILKGTSSDGNRSCRTFGYGLDNDKKVGTLHGLKILSDLYYEPGKVAFDNMEGVQHGDSGGALVCKDQQGIDSLIAVTSQMHQTDPDSPKYGSFFVATDYNAAWIDFAFAHEKLDHDSVVLYNFYEVETLNESLDQCIQDRREEGVSRKDMRDFQTAHQEIAQALKSLKSDLESGSKPAGVIRIYLDDPYKAAKGAITQCESLKNSNRRY